MYPKNRLTPEWPQLPLWTENEAGTWVSMWQAAIVWTEKLGWNGLATVPPPVPVKDETAKTDTDRAG